MTPAAKDRVKAARLRKRKAEGKTLTATDVAFLAEYERNSTRATVKRAKLAAPSKAAAAASPIVRGPQLQIAAANGRATAHETAPLASRVDPSAHTWIPTMPATPTEPGVDDGRPKPPAEGTPLVDDTKPSEPGAPVGTGDPAAAKQFATFVMFVTHLGIGAGRELLADVDVPDQVRTVLNSDELANGAIGTVGQAAERLAIKYGFQAVPLADEAIVATALVGSGLLVLRNVKRKQLANASTTKKPPDTPADEPPPPKSPLNDLWRGGK